MSVQPSVTVPTRDERIAHAREVATTLLATARIVVATLDVSGGRAHRDALAVTLVDPQHADGTPLQGRDQIELTSRLRTGLGGAVQVMVTRSPDAQLRDSAWLATPQPKSFVTWPITLLEQHPCTRLAGVVEDIMIDDYYTGEQVTVGLVAMDTLATAIRAELDATNAVDATALAALETLMRKADGKVTHWALDASA